MNWRFGLEETITSNLSGMAAFIFQYQMCVSLQKGRCNDGYQPFQIILSENILFLNGVKKIKPL